MGEFGEVSTSAEFLERLRIAEEEKAAKLANKEAKKAEQKAKKAEKQNKCIN